MKLIRLFLRFSVFLSGLSTFVGCSDSGSTYNPTGGNANLGGKAMGGATGGAGGVASFGSGGTEYTGGITNASGGTAAGGVGSSGGGLGGANQGGMVWGSGGLNTSGGALTKGGATTNGGTTSSGGKTTTGGVQTSGGSNTSGGSINLSHYRIVISSDFPPIHGAPGADPDDVQSMVRFLLYSNEFDIDGLVASANGGTGKADKKNFLDIIDLYDQVDENLRKHDSKYPSPESLKAIVHQGRDGTWNKGVNVVIGDGKDSEASNAIIDIVDRTDPRPVWFSIWGGPCEVAQAIWKVKGTRSASELKTFLSKMRIFAIATQDGSIGWLKDNFPELFIIHSNAATYWGMTCSGGDKSLCDVAWLDKNIRQGHGPLGAIYPDHGCCVKGMQEGDTPSFLHLISGYRKINDPEKPDQNGWGGAYKRNGSSNHWVDGPGGASIEKFRSAFQKEFAERADWMVQ